MDNNNLGGNQNPQDNQNSNPYAQNQYDPNYNANYQQEPQFANNSNTEQAEAKARTSKVLGIWALVTSLVCCGTASIVLAIISLVFSGQSKNLNAGNLLPNAKTAKSLAIAAIIITVVMMVISSILSAVFIDQLVDYFENNYNLYY